MIRIYKFSFFSLGNVAFKDEVSRSLRSPCDISRITDGPNILSTKSEHSGSSRYESADPNYSNILLHERMGHWRWGNPGGTRSGHLENAEHSHDSHKSHSSDEEEVWH